MVKFDLIKPHFVRARNLLNRFNTNPNLIPLSYPTFLKSSPLSDIQVYNRLQRKDIRAADVCIVILDVEITKELTISEQRDQTDKHEDRGEQADLRKLFIPIKWTWSRVQKVCGKSAKQQIMVTLAKEAKQQRHNCWMNKYKECETLGMKPADNRKMKRKMKRKIQNRQ